MTDNKVILSMIDSHGDTWLYPYTNTDEAEKALEAIKLLSDNAGDELQLEVIPLETYTTHAELVDEWTGILLHDRAKYIVQRIKGWNKVDVKQLRNLVTELYALRDEHGEPLDTQHYLDMASLPSAEIPDDVDTSYPVWAMDEGGNCLVGDGADQIEHLIDIRGAS